MLSVNIIRRFMRFFFYLLYHPFAWSYDFVAWTVSLGRWNDWVRTVIPFTEGKQILELGHGPGHLQRALLDLGLRPAGLDESRQMGLLAKTRLSHDGYMQSRLIRGLGQDLPFPDEAFDTVVATFPTEFIFEEGTLAEVRRTLKNGGKLIVLPVAWLTGAGRLDRFAAWLFRVTGQAPASLSREATNRMLEPFIQAGFQVESAQLEVKSSTLLIVIAEKKSIDDEKTA